MKATKNINRFFFLLSSVMTTATIIAACTIANPLILTVSFLFFIVAIYTRK